MHLFCFTMFQNTIQQYSPHIFLCLWTVSFKTIHLGCKPSFNEIIKIDCCTRNDEPHKTTCKNTVQDKCCNPCSANFMSLSRPSKVMSPYPRHVFSPPLFYTFLNCKSIDSTRQIIACHERLGPWSTLVNKTQVCWMPGNSTRVWS